MSLAKNVNLALEIAYYVFKHLQMDCNVLHVNLLNSFNITFLLTPLSILLLVLQLAMMELMVM